MGQRFLDFCDRCSGHCRQRTRTVETAAQPDVRGLIPADPKHRARMEAVGPDADHPALPHRLSASAWSERAVLDPLAPAANRRLGGPEDSALRMDDRGVPQQGTPSVGVGRQCGPWGKGDHGQGGVFAALSRGPDVTLLDQRWFLPEDWTRAAARGQAAGLPKAQRGFPRQADLALAMIPQARQPGIGLTGVGFDGFYGSDPAFLRALEDQGESVVGAVHPEPRGSREDPQPIVPSPERPRGHPPTRLQAQTPARRVDHGAQQHPTTAWPPVTVRDGTKGPLPVEMRHQPGWWGEGAETQARQWHWIGRRAVDTPTELQVSLRNAPADSPVPRLGFLQGQR